MYFSRACALFGAFLIIGINSATAEGDDVHPFFGLNVYEFILANNYTCENHTITTEDGYILQTFRIPYGKGESTYTKRPAVLLQHGILSSPNDWLIQGPERSLGFVLADQGYDVWLMASRGNTFSRNHQTLDTDSLEFWNFSWHEVGVHDIPANIDYITNLTENSQVSYVGHSQGGTSYAVMAAARPEYNSKIAVSLLFTPVLYLQSVRIPFFDVIKENYDNIEKTGVDLELKDILPYNRVFENLTISACTEGNIICPTILGLLCGFDFDQFNYTVAQIMTTNDPGGSSFHEFLHYLQIANSGIFRQYDWGTDGNQAAYNQATPPEYDLSLASAPIILFYSQNDFFVGVDDAKKLLEALPNVIGYEVPFEHWNHLDYLIANDVLKFVNAPAIQYLDTYNNMTSKI